MNARDVLGLLPSDCTSAMAALLRECLMESAKDAVLAQAQESLTNLGKYSAMDVCHALEFAAEKWLSSRAKGGA